jgi:prephenate dehydrogenase
MSVLFPRLLVAGVGLVGGSLAAAVRRAKLAGEVVGLGRSQENLDTALARGHVDRVSRDPETAAADVDAIVLGAPLGECAPLAARLRARARPGTLLTDVGSAKARLVPALEDAWRGVGPVVGAHPIAGREDSGAKAADPKLFENRLCILTPTTATDRAALARVRALWEGVGARVEELAPDVHDEILARVSHLPHLVAYALSAAIRGRSVGSHALVDYTGTGFQDTTRIAKSPPAMWRDIAFANASALGAALGEFRAALGRIEAALAAGDAAGLEAALAEAQAVRLALKEER